MEIVECTECGSNLTIYDDDTEIVCRICSTFFTIEWDEFNYPHLELDY